jgi:hypothetical protein
MKLRRQVVITAEKTETYVIRQEPLQPLAGFCTECKQATRHLTLDQTVNLTGLGARTIFSLVQAGEIHSCESPEGYLWLCPSSVALLIRL